MHLKEFSDTSNFKTYDELKTRLQHVIGDDIRSTESSVKTTAEGEDINDEKWSGTSTTNGDDSSDGDALSYFEKLANDD